MRKIVLILIFLGVAENLDNSYAYQTGHISLNDSEITILINSTFEIIEDFDNDTLILEPKKKDEDEKPTTSFKVITPPITTSPAPEILTTRKRKMRMKKLKPAASSLINCQQYTEAEKYKILERAGGRNQFWMADSVDEAAMNFGDFYSKNSGIDEPMQDAVGVAKPVCDQGCQMIKSALNLEIARRNSTKKKFSKRKNSTVSIMLNDSTETTCSLGSFLPVGNCSELGEPTGDGDHEALCSECRGLYMLSSNCFPQIFNSIHCNSQEMGCIFDSITDMAHGQCGIQTLAFKVLRNVGDSNCEDWKVDQILLPVSCQCSLSKNSFLRTSPLKEL